MKNSVFRKSMGNMRKHRSIKLITTERRRNYSVSELKNHAAKFSTEHLWAIKMKINEILMKKSICLEFSILEFSNILMYEFWYDYAKTKYGEKVKLCYVDTDSFIVYIKIDDISEDVETRFDTSNYELDGPLS